MTKRLSEKQKEEIVKSFKSGTAINLLSEKYACTNLTIIRNLKKSLGVSKYKEFLDSSKSFKEKSNKKQNNDLLELSYSSESLKKKINTFYSTEFIDVIKFKKSLQN